MMKPENHKQSSKKLWFLSLTLWANLLCVLCIVIEEYLHLLRPLLGDHAFAILTIVVATVNLYFRLFTSRGLLFLGYPAIQQHGYNPHPGIGGANSLHQDTGVQALPPVNNIMTGNITGFPTGNMLKQQQHVPYAQMKPIHGQHMANSNTAKEDDDEGVIE